MEVELSSTAKRELRRLDKPVARRILSRLLWLAENMNAITPTPLKGEWAGFFKLRVGDYRVLYEIIEEEPLIFVLRIGHRREIYR
ncbi:RelE/StbE replicon stabilization toxin [hydrothermal vent metagenome]|uniref:RelE/StbE replicon stabilization toxin n=1 Tax=hydrothermal vent metagenome TaxID=652676 RepID=A0A3B0VNK3_9ZZZZ